MADQKTPPTATGVPKGMSYSEGYQGYTHGDTTHPINQGRALGWLVGTSINLFRSASEEASRAESAENAERARRAAEKRARRAAEKARQARRREYDLHYGQEMLEPIFEEYKDSPNSVISNDIRQATLHEFCAAAAIALEKYLSPRLENPENKLRFQEGLYRWVVNNNQYILHQDPNFVVGTHRFVYAIKTAIYEAHKRQNISLKEAKLQWIKDNIKLRPFDEITLPDSFRATYGKRGLDRPTKTANLASRSSFRAKKLPKYVAGAFSVAAAGGIFLGYCIDDLNRAKPIHMTGDQTGVDEAVQIHVESDGTCVVPDIEIHNQKRIEFTANAPVKLRYHEHRPRPRAETVVEINSQSATHINVRFRVPESNPGIFDKERSLSCSTPNAPAESSTRGQIRTIRAER